MFCLSGFHVSRTTQVFYCVLKYCTVYIMDWCLCSVLCKMWPTLVKSTEWWVRTMHSCGSVKERVALANIEESFSYSRIDVKNRNTVCKTWHFNMLVLILLNNKTDAKLCTQGLRVPLLNSFIHSMNNI